jgi:hypothetical protein
MNAMFKNKIGLAATLLGTALAVLSPAVASARDRDEYRRDNRSSREVRDRDRDRHEQRERYVRRDRLRDRDYNNGFDNRYYQPPQGYYDQYGYWHQY